MPGFLGALPVGAYNLGGNDYSYLTPQAQAITTPAVAPNTGMFGIQGLGANLDTARLGLGGLQAVGGLWSAFQQNKLAKQAFNFQKGILDTNLANQIKSYNLGIDDKFRSRAVVEGTSADNTASNIAKWSATDQRKA